MGDPGCLDGDGDGVANDQDLCPTIADYTNLDFDGDGVGNACDSFARITGVEQGTLDSRSPGTRLTFWGTQSGPWTLRVGSTNCADGVVLDSGDYIASADRLTPTPGLAVVPAEQLPEGVVSLRLCIDSASGTVSDVTSVLHDTTAPALVGPQLNAADDTGSSSSDGITRSTSYTLSGTAEPGSTLALRANGGLLTAMTVGADGTWYYLETGPVAEGAHAYEATAQDTAGNRNVHATAVSVDLTAPSATITAGPAEGGSSAGSTSFSFTASEASSFQCRVDSGAWAGCTSPISLTGLKPGQHSLELRAADLAGNAQSDPVTRHWTVTGVTYTWTGFFDPVANEPAINTIQAGSSIPVKFSLGHDAGLNVMATGSPTSRTVACNGETGSGQPEPATSAGSSGLSYDSKTETYTYVCKTSKAWAGSCRRFTLSLNDGNSHSFLVRLR
ncbi:MAG: PxKF domain-containing protein [Mycobacteriales bacterium]